MRMVHIDRVIEKRRKLKVLRLVSGGGPKDLGPTSPPFQGENGEKLMAS